ncbi:hypothetical protein G3567_02525 [Psychroflexus sp. YR1-1]|uniref:MtN3 and saliva related transmembrane protein n=1 Tax=Psychroflexus aurantiacus TaxID=2709310 RepID=A0A6B3R599_9FLAO|nr:SemiSWEET family transporter [Psychroflexus aurantiacus]NEV93021.1 hypothetical protein [Psychroflexus aurantiacus]
MFEQIISILTVISTLSVKLIGVPSQIRKIHKNKSIENISTLHFTLSFTSYVLWTIHGLQTFDYVIIIGQGVGVITSGVLLALILHHLKKV